MTYVYVNVYSAIILVKIYLDNFKVLYTIILSKCFIFSGFKPFDLEAWWGKQTIQRYQQRS